MPQDQQYAIEAPAPPRSAPAAMGVGPATRRAASAPTNRIIEDGIMTDQQGSTARLPDPVELSQTMARIAEQSQRLVVDFMQRQKADGNGLGMGDPLNISQAFFEMTTRLMADPGKLVQAQLSLWQDYMNLWQATARRMAGEPAAPVIRPTDEDRRFKDAAWSDNHLFDYIKQSYLLSARWMQSTVRQVDGLDDRTAKKVDFYTRQFVDA